MKLETQMVVLLMLSIIALGLYHVPRSHRVDFASEDWKAYVSTDSAGTLASRTLDDRGLVVDFDLADRDSTTDVVFGKVSLQPAIENLRIDFSWLESVEIRARIDGKNEEYFRLQFRNVMPGVENLKYNEVAFKLTEQFQTLTFDRKHFQVPTWWVERHGVQLEDTIPTFADTKLLEIMTASDADKLQVQLIVEELTVHGRWIPTMVLYRSLLWMWLVLAAGVAIQNSIELRKKIRNNREREAKLKSINETLREQADELSQIARFDTLTGLLNRFGMRGYIRSALQLADDHDTTVSVILFDIDHFKKINDTKGHIHGDQLLAQLGQLLSVCTNETDAIARWGGEEFLCICCASCFQQALDQAESLREEIESEIGITCSFGVHQLRPEQTFVEAMQCADVALYKAKSNGRNRVVGYQGEHLLTSDSTPQQADTPA